MNRPSDWTPPYGKAGIRLSPDGNIEIIVHTRENRPAVVYGRIISQSSKRKVLRVMRRAERWAEKANAKHFRSGQMIKAIRQEKACERP